MKAVGRVQIKSLRREVHKLKITKTICAFMNKVRFYYADRDVGLARSSDVHIRFDEL